ncbi:MAG: PEP-CTERM sorting domain-containing protein [Sphingomonadales bacterium]
MLKRVVIAVAALASIALPTTASALPTIINLDATDPGNEFFIALDAGDYRVDPILDQFIAWNAWGQETSCDSDGENCSRGWIYSYRFDSLDTGDIGVGSGADRFATAIQAFDNAQPFAFSLSQMQEVRFYRPDSNFNDNEGGMSLQLVEVSEPGMTLLFGLGMIGVALHARRRA